MTESWKQFTLQAPGCRNAFAPLQVLHTFLPEWLNVSTPTRWHILFEPSALVRFQSETPEVAMRDAKRIAQLWGLEFIPGDTSADLNQNLLYAGEDYGGEAETYGEGLWSAGCAFMQACGGLSIEMAKLSHERQVLIMRKFIHLYGNILGLNYLEESALARYWSDRALELYETVGRS